MAASRILTCCLLLAVALGSLTATAQARIPEIDSRNLPPLAAPSVPAFAVFDESDDTLLAGAGLDDRRSIASLTKLMTALVVVENRDPDDLVRISANAAKVGEASVGLKAGQRYPVARLLEALLIYSANDAAIALAEDVGDGSTKMFVNMMNDRARRLELSNTRFATPTGLDIEGNYSTVRDLLDLARTALRDEMIRETVRERFMTMRIGGTAQRFNNRNRLIGRYPGVDGVKTGHTDRAGWCLIAHYSDNRGSDVFTVVLGAKDEDHRDAATKKLLDWARSLRVRIFLAKASDRVATATVGFARREQVRLYVSHDVAPSVRIGKTVRERIVYPSQLNDSHRAGDEVGTLEALVDGRVVASSAIYIDRDVPELSLADRLAYYRSSAGHLLDEGASTVAESASAAADYLGLTVEDS